ncbi:MAG: RraA family protein [Alphaproteobacteria bacterium]|jgi:regulator of RNase E activity RraA|nr:acyl transferase [Rhodospirillaceae bacterium]MDP6405363.1 RraA family protein [Alphaproteobacteria bacterium]MDP6623361.1 RraA family protein [Alphaproteobacteria bacterium]|tara:strand:+ start:2018 stop:2722 length:705 start_codon:yes stop_codon:yes gene_type:complete
MASDSLLNEDELAALRALDTPTVCNALELVCPDRRGFGFSSEPMFCLDPSLPPLVGYAKTLTIRSTEPPEGNPLKTRLEYYRHLVADPQPAVAVIQDLDGDRAGFGSFWGEVNSNIHRGLGCAGVITDGSTRDLDDIAPGFQILARKVVPSHAWVHPVEIGGRVEVFGMAVAAGDLVHADRHGAVVVPHEVAREVPAAAALVGRREAVILEACAEPDFDVERLGEAMGQAAKIS